MRVKILGTKAIKLSGRLYQPGAIAEVSAQTARVLRAVKRASDYEVASKPMAPPKAPKVKPTERAKPAEVLPAPPTPQPAPNAPKVRTTPVTPGDPEPGAVPTIGTEQGYNRRDITP